MENWRFLMGLYRAYYDAYVRRRLIHETDVDAAVLDVLRKISPAGPCQRSMKPRKSSGREAQPVAPATRERIVELADKLLARFAFSRAYRFIARLAWIVRDARYGRLPHRRHPLFQGTVRCNPCSTTKRPAVTDSTQSSTGPTLARAGSTDDLGNLSAQPHLILKRLPFAEDPASFESPRLGVEEAPDVDILGSRHHFACLG